MHLTKHEKDKLLLYVAGELAKNRLKRGVKLNYPECIALISCHVIEGARTGKKISKIIKECSNLLKKDQVMDGIPELANEILVEATFPDGTKLVTIHNPIKGKSKNIPGEYKILNKNIQFLTKRPKINRKVTNTGTRAIQVGSHFHFYEVNKYLKFKRENTEGYRLNIPSGTSIRFEPKETKKITLVKIGGLKKIYGFSGKTNKTT